jgi:adenine-specific DNA-methyltransferase
MAERVPWAGDGGRYWERPLAFAATALTLEEKLAGQKEIKVLETQRTQKRRSLFEAQDEVDRQREVLIATIERKLDQNITAEKLFAMRWQLG